MKSFLILNRGTWISSKNKKLAKELQKKTLENVKKQKVHLLSIDNILGADLADMQLLSKFSA